MNDNKGKKYLRLLAALLAVCLAAVGGFFFGKNKATDIKTPLPCGAVAPMDVVLCCDL